MRFSGNKLVLIILGFSLFVAVFFSFYRYYVKNNFLTFGKAPCNPTINRCFVHICEDWDSRCSKYPDNTFFYKVIIRNQKNLLSCIGQNCLLDECAENEDECDEFFCSEENLAEFELDDVCSNDDE